MRFKVTSFSYHFLEQNTSILCQLDLRRLVPSFVRVPGPYITSSIHQPEDNQSKIAEQYAHLHLQGPSGTQIGRQNILQTFSGSDIHPQSLAPPLPMVSVFLQRRKVHSRETRLWDSVTERRTWWIMYRNTDSKTKHKRKQMGIADERDGNS
jgi:hypothetical protein